MNGCKYWRERANLTQGELARLAGVTVTTIANIEHERNRPRASTLELILAFFREWFPGETITVRDFRMGVDK